MFKDCIFLGHETKDLLEKVSSFSTSYGFDLVVDAPAI